MKNYQNGKHLVIKVYEMAPAQSKSAPAGIRNQELVLPRQGTSNTTNVLQLST